MNPRFAGGDEKATTTTTKRTSDISAACTGETDIERTNEAFNFPADDTTLPRFHKEKCSRRRRSRRAAAIVIAGSRWRFWP